jgi:hypothetical protein
MELPTEFAQAHGMGCRPKLQAEPVFTRTIMALIMVAVHAPPSRGAATDPGARPQEEASAPNNRAVARVAEIRTKQSESGDLTPELTVSVFVFNSAHIANHDLAKAEARAAEIFEKSGIKLIWMVGLTVRDPVPHSRGAAWNPTNLDLRIWTRRMTRGSTIPSNALGYRLSMKQAVVLADAIQDLAKIWGKHAADLLGVAMAHEIAHLLLQNSEHSTIGMMQPRYLQKDLISFERGHLLFSGKEIKSMRGEVRRRMSMQIDESFKPKRGGTSVGSQHAGIPPSR